MGGIVSSAWADALLAARLLAVDPGLGGIVVRSAPGPLRDRWLGHYRGRLGPDAPFRRLPATIDDERLIGGLDLAATLAANRPIVMRGVLAEADGGTVVVPMAERIDAPLAGRLAAVHDTGEVVVERDGVSLRLPARIVLVLLDEGIAADERAPPALVERIAFSVDLDRIAWQERPSTTPRGAVPLPEDGEDLSSSPSSGRRTMLLHGGGVAASDPVIATLCSTAAAFGVDSARATLFALRAARAHAALSGRSEVMDEDVIVAARLVLVPRATRLPAPPAEEESPEAEDNTPPPGDADTDRDATEQQLDASTEIVVEAVRAALPADVLAALGGGRAVAGRRSGEGAKRKSAKRGRPVGSHAGMPGGGARLALVDTLRAAAPWQMLRRAVGSARIVVRRQDFRIRRFVERAETTLIFAVDASGSAAIARLAETKGAVELLLAEAYVKRTQVALVAFRGSAAELILPPTRSLARAKRCLADMAGGGGTPLAAGFDRAREIALAARAKGRTPFVVVLTDGRANIGRDGVPSRERASADALTAARAFAVDRLAAVFIDTSPRPGSAGAALAAAMGARYAPLPRVDAAAMADVVRALAPT